MCLCLCLVHEWTWDKENAAYTIILSENNLEVKFHNGYSYGTAAVRGTKVLEKGRHHYWEVKMLTSIYGTDIVNIFQEKLIRDNLQFLFVNNMTFSDGGCWNQQSGFE